MLTRSRSETCSWRLVLWTVFQALMFSANLQQPSQRSLPLWSRTCGRHISFGPSLRHWATVGDGIQPLEPGGRIRAPTGSLRSHWEADPAGKGPGERLRSWCCAWRGEKNVLPPCYGNLSLLWLFLTSKRDILYCTVLLSPWPGLYVLSQRKMNVCSVCWSRLSFIEWASETQPGGHECKVC